MASNFTTSVDNTPDLQDGVDYIEADDINVPKDSAEAAQTFIGASGAPQSKNTDILTQIFALKPTIRLSYVDADTIQASAGVSKPTNSAVTVRELRKNTSTTNITGADLDAAGPNFAADTTYFVYSDGDATATTLVFVVSTNASTPTGPTVFELVGGFATDSSGDVIESTVWSKAGMRVVNTKTEDFSTYPSGGTGTIPYDDTKPQNTEGNALFEIDYVPQDANNILIIEVEVNGVCNSSVNIQLALFQDSTADAIKATSHILWNSSGSSINRWTMHHKMAAGTTSKTTFKVRGGGTAGTFFVNGDGTARRFGGIMTSTITITEYEI